MSNAKKIWEILLANGCTEAGAAGVIGNMAEESGLEPCRMQGDFNREGYPASKAYAEKIDSGRMTRNQFAYDTIGGGGWGLCQWTFWSRKAGLYDFCKARAASIGDLTAQVLYFCEECKSRYTDVWETITTTKDVQAASDAVLLKYERPAGMYDKRLRRGNRSRQYFEELTELTEKTATSTTEEVETVATCTVTLDQIKKGDTGAQVKSAQLLLIGKGFSCGHAGADGDLGTGTDTAIRKYQKAKGLNADGIVGAKTWESLLKK